MVLKACEGIIRYMSDQIKLSFEKNWFTKLCALAALPVLKQVKRKLDPSRYNGASFIGLNGIVIKSHGSADVKGYSYAITEAVLEVEKNVPQLIRQQVGQLLEEMY